jgi:hypothetical protein
MLKMVRVVVEAEEETLKRCKGYFAGVEVEVGEVEAD